MIRVITIAREYGSGGGATARRVAALLGWRLVDREIIAAAARAAHLSPEDVAALDEHPTPWLTRMIKAFWRGGPEGFAGAPNKVFDGEAMADLTRRLLLDLADEGDCVVVGRGAQCALAGRDDVFHVFVHAPRADRFARIRPLYADDADAEEALDHVDRDRARYVQRAYGRRRLDPDLYDLIVNTRLGVERCAAAILAAAGLEARPR